MMANDLSLVTVNGTIDTNDLLSIVTSRSEVKLHNELAAAKVKLQEADALVKNLQDSLVQAYKRVCLQIGEDLADTLRPGVSKAGGRVVVPPVQSYQLLHEATQAAEATSVTYCARVFSNDHNNGYVMFSKSIDVPSELTSLLSDLRAAAENMSRCSDAALQIRKRIANIPMLERKARARLAEAKLSESDEGRALLEALTGNFEADLLSLPGN